MSQGRWSMVPANGLTGWMTANSMSRQQILPTLPISWAPEYPA
jgi:hypothetical protein